MVLLLCTDVEKIKNDDASVSFNKKIWVEFVSSSSFIQFHTDCHDDRYFIKKFNSQTVEDFS